ncbi:Trans-feruloyl-CoA synthase FCS1 [Paraburkholderia nemoris]|uniref:acetate--CoA ligase family protein n=1 Tax=Paraburkholderia nemoris TaxID=2793076 RepID=UPI00190D1A2E|nr:acetate--CoA ligase [Paraburkholderia nemoris]MBK3744989.1 succinate--CoA ligase [Paraburkholderia aspalathi]CAE6854521.1 Trans-feruloyl-CoA synthase FCS1 [Paraburkholderia nemoris]
MFSSTPYLRELYEPRHIVIVGFSLNEEKEPIKFLNVLLKQGYSGKISLLGRERGTYQGCDMYANAEDLPGDIDLAFSMLSAEKTLEVLPKVAARGVSVAVVFTSGFAEMGVAGAKLQESVVEACNKNGMRLVGPNCPGYFYLPNKINLTGILGIPSGPVGMISQSGNVGITLWDQAAMLDIGFSAFVGVGNQSDVPIHDHIEYLGSDDNTKVIALYIEGLPADQGTRFISICREVSKKKPIVALKGGRTTGGMRAAQSHTAAMSSASKIYSALFEDCGVIEVHHLEHLLPICEVLYRCPPMKGRRIAIVGSGGGHSTVCTDEVEIAGLTVPEFNQELQDAFSKRLPAYAPKRNPIDMTGGFTKDPSLFAQMTKLVLEHDTSFDGFINYGLYGLWHGGEVHPDSPCTYASAAPILGLVQTESELPIIFYTPYAYQKDASFTALRNAGVPCYADLNLCALGLAALNQRHRHLSAPDVSPSSDDPPCRAGILDVSEVLTEASAINCLEKAGIRFPKFEECQTSEEVAMAAGRIGFPVVLKAVLPGVLHKSDLGGVATGLGSIAETQRAAEEMSERITSQIGAHRQRGFLVCEDVGRHRELFAGVRTDSLMGTVGLIGFGGVYAEAVGDTSVCLLPATPERIAASFSRLRSASMWGEFRGEASVSMSAISQFLNKLNSALLNNASVTAIECNPVMTVGSELVAVDAAVEYSKVS